MTSVAITTLVLIFLVSINTFFIKTSPFNLAELKLRQNLFSECVCWKNL